MSKKKKITKTLIAKVLRESSINPYDAGPLQMVVEAHYDSPWYLEMKGKECVDEAQLAMRPEVNNIGVYAEKMQKAIFFLAIARCIREKGL